MTTRLVLDNGTPLQVAGDANAPHAIIVLQEAFGVNDLGTARHLSDLLGQRTVMVRQHSRSGKTEYDQSAETYSATSRALLMPQEIMRLPRRKEILLLQGKEPILADRVRYFADKEFKGLFDPNPMIGAERGNTS